MGATEDGVAAELLAELQATPDDLDLRARTACALEAAGRPREAAGVLTERHVHLTAHEDGPLPCLCKRCFDPDRVRAQAEGVAFQREFAFAAGRVLFFWSPVGLGRRNALEQAVGRRLDRQLREADRRRRERGRA